MTLSRKEMVAAILLVAGFIVLLVALYFSLTPTDNAAGFEDNFIVQQRIRIQNQNK
ncbi:MAG TPA: hypothetical protein PLJ47_03385 [Candidatus Hydrogenedentes bacterium]|nr:hypothetical protein [Candidatus Hydrogenedentota bacterium]HRK33615.1 hypothetical protein [Candidatus Hydrogenedentota bacterium]